jgi:serine/threonine-protein kinase
MASLETRLRLLRDALPGHVLAGTAGHRYPIGERLGEGGQGWVYRATWNEPDGHPVVVKVLRPDETSPDALARFEREASVLRRLSHPHIVRFFDHAHASVRVASTGDTWDLPFTVLEYVHGATLEDVLSRARGEGLGLERARRILRHVGLALQDVHAQGIIHRDLKPSNILIDASAGRETAKVTDFGLAKLAEPSLQRTSALAGVTVGYAPPEQFELGNARVTPRTDVFSFAAIAYETLTGRPAFPLREGEHALIVVTRILNEARPALGRSLSSLPRELQARPDIVAALDEQLARALDPDPMRRHESITELGRAIDGVLASLEAPQVRVPPVPVIPQAAPSYGSLDEAFAKTALADITGPVTRVDAAAAAHHVNRAPTPSRARWAWRVATPAVRPGAVRSARFAPNGAVAIAIGANGMTQWIGERWANIPLDPSIDPRAVRGLTWLANQDLLIFGDASFAARLSPNAGAVRWRSPAPDVVYLGAHVDANGTATLVGERSGARGEAIACVAQLSEAGPLRLFDVAGCARLNAVTRVNATTLLACGDPGMLASLPDHGIPRVVKACEPSLHAVAALPDGTAAAAGSGGFVFRVWPDARYQLETIQTTKDLTTLTIANDGVAWVGGVRTRVLRREGNEWLRVGADIGSAATLVAIWASAQRVLAIADDGAVLEGALR